jgi:hypothetical protein
LRVAGKKMAVTCNLKPATYPSRQILPVFIPIEAFLEKTAKNA